MMKTGTLLTKWAAAFLAAMLMIFLFAIPAFAETETTTAATEAETTAETTGEEETSGEEETTTSAETTGSETTSEEETTSGTASSNNDKKGLTLNGIVWIVVGGIILVAVAVIFFVPKFREKAEKFLRVYKSESKKIVWLSWDQTKKNTLVVIIILVVCAAAICLIDFGLNQGVLSFIGLFK